MTDGGDSLSVVVTVLWMVLIASAIIARRLPMKDMARMALGWIAIFLFAFGVFAFKDDFKIVWQRLVLAVNPNTGTTVGKELRLPQQDDHWYVDAQVNGSPVRFLVDTGATTISMNQTSAELAGVDFGGSSFPVAINTANGLVQAKRGTIKQLQVGPIGRKDIAVVVAPEFGDTNVLGMNFLSSLSSWRVETGTLVLVD